MGTVFLSYSHVDSAVADSVVAVLEELGIGFFRDVKDIEWGGSISREVRAALERSVAVLVILSPASLKSQWVPYEVGYSRALHKRVLPFLTHPSLEVPGYMGDLRHLTGVDRMREYLASAPLPGEAVIPEIRIDLLPQPTEAKILSAMPQLLRDLQECLALEGAGLVREIVLVPNKRVVFTSDKKRFKLNEDEYEDLKLKFDLLMELGLAYDVTISHTPIFRMTEEFVDWLREAVLEAS